MSEVEARTALWDHAGKIKLLGFLNRGRMGDYNAMRWRWRTRPARLPDTALVRAPATRPGGALNLAQQVSDDLGVFLRASLNDGSKEAYEFTDINRSLRPACR